MPRLSSDIVPTSFPQWRRYIAATCLLGLLAMGLQTWPAMTQPKAHAVERAGAAGHGMVVSVSAPGSEVGKDILLKGGNAVDAAVSTAFALAVTYPPPGNIGGRGLLAI